MTRTCSLSLKKLFIYIIFFSLFLQSAFSENSNNEFSEDEKEWIVAGEKFVFAKGQKKNSLNDGLAETIPQNILEGLNQSLTRVIKDNEELERIKYKLRTKRQSLYLQLSSEYQKLDGLFLSYSGNKLKSKKEEQNKKIEEIQQQINENLLQLEEAENDSLLEKDIPNATSTKSTYEKIKVYGGENSSLFSLSSEIKNNKYDSPAVVEEIYEKGINSLITGTISSYGNYLSVSVDVYMYPSGKIIGSVMEIGAINDLDFITSSIINQLIPLLTNSMPVNLVFNIEPSEALKTAKIYIDDILQNTESGNLIINSGVHSFKINVEGYKSLATSYYFEGNKSYNIEVKLEEKNDGDLIIGLAIPLNGNIYVNGELSEKINDKESKIVINGNQVLGQFISEDGYSSFFYIPEDLFSNENYVTINPKAIDRSEIIETRRKWMYGAYSVFMVSLIPTFIVRGNFLNQLKLYNDGNIDYNTALNWQTASNVCVGVSAAFGIFWVVELVRYLLAANSVLPEKANAVNLIDLENNRGDAGGEVETSFPNENPPINGTPLEKKELENIN